MDRIGHALSTVQFGIATTDKKLHIQILTVYEMTGVECVEDNMPCKTDRGHRSKDTEKSHNTFEMLVTTRARKC